MAYLRENSHAARLARINRDGIELLPVWRSRLLRRLGKAKISGHLGSLDGHPAALYLAGNRLWLAVDAQAWHLDEIEATVDDNDENPAGEIRTPLQRYSFTADRQSRMHATAFSDIEDVSFGLWTARIVNDLDRQQVLRETLQDTSLAAMPEHGAATDTDNVIRMLDWRLDNASLHGGGKRSAE